jgi:hypothetical protein
MNESTFKIPHFHIEKTLDLLSKGQFYSSTNMAEYCIRQDREQMQEYIDVLNNYFSGAIDVLTEGLKVAQEVELD